MTAPSRHRAAGALLAFLAVAALVVTPWGAASATSAVPFRPGQQDPGPAVSLSLVDQGAVAEPDGVHGIVARATGAPPDATLEAKIYNPIKSRGDYGKNLFGVRLGASIKTLPRVPVDAVEAGPNGSRDVGLPVPLCNLSPCDSGEVQLTRGGVYPVDIRLLDADDDELARLLTFMVRLPDDNDEVTPLVTSLLIDRDGPPVLDPGGARSVSTEQVASVMLLTRMLTDHPDVPVTFSPTPEMVESVGLDSEDVVSKLAASLQQSASQVVAGPYVDVPTAAWVTAALDEELERQRARGTEALRTLPSPDVTTWVAEPTLSEPAAAKLLGLGVGNVVVDAGGLAAPERSKIDLASLLGPFEVGAGTIGNVAAVSVDPVLRGVFTRPDDPVQKAHRLLAELAVIAYEAPEEQRGVVVSPPPDWKLSEDVLTILLQGLGQADRLLEPRTVAQLFEEVPPLGSDGRSVEKDEDDEEDEDDEAPLRLRLAPPVATELGDYPARLGNARRLLDSYGAMLGAPNRTIGDYDDRLLASGAVELTAPERNGYLDGVTGALDEKFDGVNVPEEQTVTLTSADGQLPLTVQNTLDEPVTVEIALSSSERLEFPGGTGTNSTVKRVDLAAQESTSVKVPVRTRATGDTPIQVVVRTPGGGRTLQVATYNVRSTAVSGVGLFLTIGAAGFLALWWFRHVRLVRRERRELASGPPDGSGTPLAVE